MRSAHSSGMPSPQDEVKEESVVAAFADHQRAGGGRRRADRRDVRLDRRRRDAAERGRDLPRRTGAHQYAHFEREVEMGEVLVSVTGKPPQLAHARELFRDVGAVEARREETGEAL